MRYYLENQVERKYDLFTLKDEFNQLDVKEMFIYLKKTRDLDNIILKAQHTLTKPYYNHTTNEIMCRMNVQTYELIKD